MVLHDYILGEGLFYICTLWFEWYDIIVPDIIATWEVQGRQDQTLEPQL